MSQMSRNEFFHAIAESFFKDLETDLDGLKDMIRGALPVFGTLETEITEKEDGGKYIRFIDRDEAQFVIVGEGVSQEDLNDLDTDMSCVVIGLHLDEENKITIVEHTMKIFTRANKNSVLLCASLIGKKILFDEGE
jgi:hypothetical protein